MEIHNETGSDRKKAICLFCHCEQSLESGLGKDEMGAGIKTKGANPASRKESSGIFWLKGITVIFLMAGIFFVLYYCLFFGRRYGVQGGLILSFIGSMFMLLSVTRFRMALFERNTLRLMQKVLRKENSGSFSDGEEAVFFGKIYPLDGKPIPTPFSRQPGVFYRYRIYRWARDVHSGARNRFKKQDAFNGLCQIPCYVQTETGKAGLFSYSLLVGFPRKTYSYPADQEIYREAANYLQSTQFTERPWGDVMALGSAVEQIKEIFSEDDSIRMDNKFAQVEFGLETCSLEEEYVLAGDDVCLQGFWSAEKQGVVSNLRKAQVFLTKGSPAEVMDIVRGKFKKEVWAGSCVALFINMFFCVFYFITILAVFWGSGGR